ncbi:hypothetical protein ACFLIM_40880 [Nonomuraea sp. M3C6]|uniref:DUF4190 domain-containing protein n=1 Tax=Nonomuraea marmarensis TaxID=3351344 RepID=A0ABW7ARB5_9ACTN
MTTPGGPDEPRSGQDPREGRPEEDEQHTPAWWDEGHLEEEAPGEEPITPVPPVVPPPDVPPTHEPRPTGEPTHPDLPTSPETPEPTGSDAEETQVYPIPGATPPYPGWEGAPSDEEGPARRAPSRYEQDDQPSFAPPGGETPPGGVGPAGGETPSGEGVPPGEATPPMGTPAVPYPGAYPPDQEPSVPGTQPSSPYGGPPGYGPPPGSPYGPPYQPTRPGNGLATASLVLGVASPFLVFVCFTGVITAILSIVFGCVALAKHVGKGRAIAGIVISVLSLILFAIVAIWFWNVVQECAQLPGQLADRCFEDKFPWMSGRS